MSKTVDVEVVAFCDIRDHVEHVVTHELDAPGIGMWCSCGCSSDSGACNKSGCYHCDPTLPYTLQSVNTVCSESRRITN